MKLKYKLALTIAIVTTMALIIVIGTYTYLNRNSQIESVNSNIENNLHFVSLQIEEDLNELIRLTEVIGSIYEINDGLIQSNAEFAALSQIDRDQFIEDLNTQWMNTSDIEDPFITERMDNEIATHLIHHQIEYPDLFGEIFLTNEYGVMIATTGKLTTLAHYDKYWWQGSYNDGEGMIYLDDRGYDASVEGYVLGIVVPIYDDQGEILGLLKVNYNIAGILTKTIESMQDIDDEGVYQIVRTLGLIVSEEGVIPLSETIETSILPELLLNETKIQIMEIDGNSNFVGVAPIALTFESEIIEFGGSYESDDHIGGNLGEGWSIVYRIDTSIALNSVTTTLLSLIYVSIFFILGIFVLATILGQQLSRPMNSLMEFTKIVGKGDLSSRLLITDKNEFGDLALSFNKMIENLENTITTKDVLEKEITERKILETRLIEMSRIDELTNIFNRRAFNDFLNKYYENAIRYDENLAIILFDIDDFKDINDKHGHLIGDKVLIKISKVISKSVRQSDVFARWGGEEFILLLPKMSKEKATEFSERIRKQVANIKFSFKEQVTISLGVSLLCNEDTKDQFLSNADKAMYQAKGEGKNKTILFNKECKESNKKG